MAASRAHSRPVTAVTGGTHRTCRAVLLCPAGHAVNAAVEGFALGLAYAAPIGAQNVYVIRSAAGGPLRLSLRTALVVTAMDVSLSLACVYGLGTVLNRLSWLGTAMTAVGAAFLLWKGVGLLRERADAGDGGPGEETAGAGGYAPFSYAWGRAAAAAFTLTWFNPQALVDGTLLLGGFRAQLSPADVPFFVGGMAAASAVWFHGLTLLIGSFRKRFGPRAMRWISWVCGAALCLLGVRLALRLL